MKRPILLFVFTICLAGVFSPRICPAKNILSDILNIYQTYENVNMLLWLTGDIKAEKRFGQEVKWFINFSNKTEKDPELNRWVQSVFNRVKTQYRDLGFNYNIAILKGNPVNAFAIPGGSLFIYRGMLDFVGSDDELAAVLAHELAHAERRHSLKQLRTSVAFQLLLEKAVRNKRDKETWGQLVGVLTLLQFSREHEDESDDIGQKKMYAAGFDPSAQIVLWEKFSHKFGKGEKGILGYLTTHPPSQSRVENARKNLKKMNLTEHNNFSLSFNILHDEQQNLLQNGSFETDLGKRGFPDSWQSRDGTVNISTTEMVTGRHSLRLYADNHIRQVRGVSELISIQPNEKYSLSGWLKTENGDQKTIVGAEIYNSSKRLRGYIWPTIEAAPKAASWSKFNVLFEPGTDAKKHFPKDAAFMKIILQTGPLSKGSVWFDELVLQKGSYRPPVNLISNPSFEISGSQEVPQGVTGTTGALSQDKSRYKIGYSSLKMQGRPNSETEMKFAPIPVSNFKDGQKLNLTFYHCANSEIKAHLIVELVDAAENTLTHRFIDREFTAKPNLWQATNYQIDFNPSPNEKSLAKSVTVRVAGSIPASGSIWLDGFVFR